MKGYLCFLLFVCLVQKVVVSYDDGSSNNEASNVPSPTSVSPKPPKPPSSNGGGSSGGGGGSGGDDDDDDDWMDWDVDSPDFSFTFYMANTTMDCFNHTIPVVHGDAIVVKNAANWLLKVDNSTTIHSVSFTTMKKTTSSSRSSSYITSMAMTTSVQNTVVATTIVGESKSSSVKAKLSAAIYSGALQSDLRYYSRIVQPNARLNEVVVCNSVAYDLNQVRQ